MQAEGQQNHQRRLFPEGVGWQVPSSQQPAIRARVIIGAGVAVAARDDLIVSKNHI
jgi:hypothetical protein